MPDCVQKIFEVFFLGKNIFRINVALFEKKKKQNFKTKIRAQMWIKG